MRTDIEAINILFSYIKNTDLITSADKINGGLYMMKRPLNSEKEDIVINSLPINNDELQECILNVNIYVPDISISMNGVNDNKVPNNKRLNDLAKIAIAALEDFYDAVEGYSFNFQQIQTFQDENDQHYVNIRVEFFSIK